MAEEFLKSSGYLELMFASPSSTHTYHGKEKMANSDAILFNCQ